jgi:hypothetical protein
MSSFDWSFLVFLLPATLYELQTFLHSTRPYLSSSSSSFHSSFLKFDRSRIPVTRHKFRCFERHVVSRCAVYPMYRNSALDRVYGKSRAARGRDRCISRPRPTAESPPLWLRWRVSFVQVRTEDNPQSEPERCDVHVLIMPIQLSYSLQ